MPGQFAVIVLAAGASTRLGQPKQLLPYKGKTLVEHAAQTALASGAHEVLVITGAHHDQIHQKLTTQNVRVLKNENWQEGMASSIRAGIAALSPQATCALITLCDQPSITPQHLKALADKQRQTQNPIVATAYENILGVPAAFAAELFPQLKTLKGDQGARDLIRTAPNPPESIPHEQAHLDIDTPEDVDRLTQ